MLTGGSAGGLATFIHADRVSNLVRAAAPQLHKFVAAPVDGYFLPHANSSGGMVFSAVMHEVVTFHNVTAAATAATAAPPQGALSPQCVNDRPAASACESR